jgi:starch phosphorylase
MLDDAWPALRFGEIEVESDGERHVFDVQVCLGELDPEAVGMELYAEGVDGAGPTVVKMMRSPREQGPVRWHVYSAQVPAARPAADYTARLVPHYPGIAVPLECARILWQR